MIEIISTRVSKVAFGYNFQFIILSLALAGIGVGGVLIFFLWKKIFSKKTENILAFLFIIFSLSTIFPFLIIHYANIYSNAAIKLLFFFSSFFTYLLGGMAISLIFGYYSKKIPLLYSITFIGSAFGSLGVILILENFGTSASILFNFLLVLFASLSCFVYANLKKRFIFSLSLIILLTLLFFNQLLPNFQIACSSERKILFSESNSFSQIDAYRINPKLMGREWGANYKWNTSSIAPATFRMDIDCIGITDLIEYNKSKNIEFISYDIRNFPHIVKNYSNVIIVGSGAGIDVARAVLANNEKITAVEINPIVVKSVDKIVAPENNVYNSNSVNLIISEARGYISNSDKKYDLIYIPGAKRYGGLGVTPYAFIENYLYTEEAFKTYFAHLTNDGILAFDDLNWFIQRYAETGLKTMEDMGINPEGRVVIVQGEYHSVLMFKKAEFADQEKKRIVENANVSGFSNKFLDKSDVDYYLTDMVSVTDDHPFYWNQYMITNIFNPSKVKYESYLTSKNEMFLSLQYLFILFLSTLLIFALIVFVPFVLKKGLTLQKIPYLLTYFSSIGIGFMIFELTLIQKFTLLLGHPIFSISVVLTSIFLFGGIGSLISKRFGIKKLVPSIIKVIAFFAIFSIILILLLDAITKNFSNSSLPIRMILSLVLLSVPSSLMGMLFPSGLRITELNARNLIPWMYGIDGVASILGGVMSMIISLLFGFNIALIFGVVFYLFALFAMWKLKT